MVSQDQLSLDGASSWMTGPSTWTSFLCTCLLAVVAFLVGKYVLTPKRDPAVPYSVTIPPQLASDYQWDVKGKKSNADSPEVSGHNHRST